MRGEPGELLAGRYEVTERVAEGGMGMVLRCHDGLLDREVAVKLILPKMINAQSALGRFHREAQLMARLGHPHIVQIFDLETHDDILFVVMEYLPGPDLGDLLARSQGGLSPHEAVRYTKSVASALEALHGLPNPIVHRDLKPANLVLDAAGNVKICDFGIAVAPGSAQERFTQIGANAIGTPAYMSPEQVRVEDVGPLSDIFSLGSVLYALLAGGPPFGIGDPAKAAILNEDPEPIETYQPKTPPDLAGLITVMLAKDPLARPDALEVHRRLGLLLDGPSSEATVPPGADFDFPSLREAERLLEDGRPGEAYALFKQIAKGTSGAERIAAEFGRTRAKLTMGKDGEAGLKWARTFAEAKRTLGEGHPLVERIKRFGAERSP